VEVIISKCEFQGVPVHIDENSGRNTETADFLAVFPNPVNESIINIIYIVNNASNIQLLLYDIFGREIKTLKNQPKEPGNYYLSVDISQLKPGIYYINMKENGMHIWCKKIIVM